MQMSQLTPNLFVGPQITPQMVATLAAEGFTDLVCHRPDAEHPLGDTSQKIGAAATKAGLVFHYDPITIGAPMTDQPRNLAGLVGQADRKVFAYCRSGGRAANAWAAAQSGT